MLNEELSFDVAVIVLCIVFHEYIRIINVVDFMVRTRLLFLFMVRREWTTRYWLRRLFK